VVGDAVQVLGGLADVIQGDHENREGYRVALRGALSK
jgi:hypothetical protein